MADVQDTAPDFTLPRDGGDTVTLSDLRGQAVVLFFYPRDNTAGCTKESIGFSEALQDFAEARNHGLLGRLAMLRRTGLYRQGVQGTLSLYLAAVLRRI